ncbi:MAG: RNHCP domain-containing protein [Candidatus Pacebacteria bacterium]|nr:RNHCP domain-containing protein [Candidatus Paceibacterota bacterium]
MFKRVEEDFICERCGYEVPGSGYTNHCPECLWSKHVDNEPGDRANECGGMMRPVALEPHHSEYRILHRCTLCGHEKYNKLQEGDIFDPELVLNS